MTAVRMIVMTGLELMIQRAPGMGMKLILARQVIREMAPVRPTDLIFEILEL